MAVERIVNPLLCDPVEGVCEVPANQEGEKPELLAEGEKPITIIYFTDPICSSCWGIEPQLRRLKLEYADVLEMEYHMGGLLPDWSYNSGGISKPADVAHHWDEVSQYYQMPIDGDVWLEDPLHSSYPPSIAFKAAQLQDENKAITFLRAIRERVFLGKRNITKWEHLSDAAEQVGLEAFRLKGDYENGAKTLFQNDLDLAHKYGVRGFPTIFVTDGMGNQERVYGYKPYRVFEDAIAKVYPGVKKTPYDKSWESLFDIYPTLATREFAELSEITLHEAEELLENLTIEKKLSKFQSKNGPMWIAG